MLSLQLCMVVLETLAGWLSCCRGTVVAALHPPWSTALLRSASRFSQELGCPAMGSKSCVCGMSCRDSSLSTLLIHNLGSTFCQGISPHAYEHA